MNEYYFIKWAILSGEVFYSNLSIRLMREDDLMPLYDILSDSKVMQYIEPPFELDAIKKFLSEAGLSDSPLIYAVENKDKNFIGYVIFHDYDENSMELGWILNYKEWGKGYASALTKLLIEKARDMEKNIVIECAPEQTATKAIAEKNGFHFVDNIDGCDVFKLNLIE